MVNYGQSRIAPASAMLFCVKSHQPQKGMSGRNWSSHRTHEIFEGLIILRLRLDLCAFLWDGLLPLILGDCGLEFPTLHTNVFQIQCLK